MPDWEVVVRNEPDLVAPATHIEVDYIYKPVEVGEHIAYCKKLDSTAEMYGIPEYEVGYIVNDYCAVRKCRKCGHLNEEYEY